jgi:hypothetical protein
MPLDGEVHSRLRSTYCRASGSVYPPVSSKNLPLFAITPEMSSPSHSFVSAALAVSISLTKLPAICVCDQPHYSFTKAMQKRTHQYPMALPLRVRARLNNSPGEMSYTVRRQTFLLPLRRKASRHMRWCEGRCNGIDTHTQLARSSLRCAHESDYTVL